MVDNSTSPLRTHFELVFSSFDCTVHGLRNEFYLISELVWERPSLLSSFHKAEIFLIPCQKKARELNGPVKPLQPKVHLVAHPVGLAGPLTYFHALALKA
jgi:hypothetical protein